MQYPSSSLVRERYYTFLDEIMNQPEKALKLDKKYVKRYRKKEEGEGSLSFFDEATQILVISGHPGKVGEIFDMFNGAAE